MKYLILNGKKLTSKEVFHDWIEHKISPRVYGRNLDALYDVLRESHELKRIRIDHYRDLEVHLGDLAPKLRALFEDLKEERQISFTLKP